MVGPIGQPAAWDGPGLLRRWLARRAGTRARRVPTPFCRADRARQEGCCWQEEACAVPINALHACPPALPVQLRTHALSAPGCLRNLPLVVGGLPEEDPADEEGDALLAGKAAALLLGHGVQKGAHPLAVHAPCGHGACGMNWVDWVGCGGTGNNDECEPSHRLTSCGWEHVWRRRPRLLHFLLLLGVPTPFTEYHSLPQGRA
jgi:hypothetical protein